jgi:hypothetical protein
MLPSDEKAVLTPDDEMQLSDSSVNHSQKQPKMSLETADFVHTPQKQAKTSQERNNFFDEL